MEMVLLITIMQINHSNFTLPVIQALKDIAQIEIPYRDPAVRQVFHLYMLRVKERDRLLKHLNEKEIEAKIHYPIPLHLQKASEYLGYKKGDFPNCERDCDSIISLPVHQHLTDEQIQYMIDCIRKFYGSTRFVLRQAQDSA